MTLNRFVLWIIVIPNLKEFSDSKFRFWLNVELNTLYNLKDIVHLTNVLSLLLLVDKVHEGSFGSSIKTVSRNRVPGSSFTWSTTFRTSSILFTNLPPIIARKSPCSMRFKFWLEFVVRKTCLPGRSSKHRVHRIFNYVNPTRRGLWNGHQEGEGGF